MPVDQPAYAPTGGMFDPLELQAARILLADPWAQPAMLEEVAAVLGYRPLPHDVFTPAEAEALVVEVALAMSLIASAEAQAEACGKRSRAGGCA
jgi:hypothetical protein